MNYAFDQNIMNENELMGSVSDKLNRMAEYDKKELIACQRNKTDLQGLVDFVNSIFAKYQINDRITCKHIRFNAGYIGNILKVDDKKLSQIIFDKYFPKPTRQSYYHFTSFEAFKSILENKKLRLSNLNKRFNDGEFTTFYEEHGMDGYKKGGVIFGIDCSDKAIMSKIFFLSLTGSGYNHGDNTLWRDFGDNGDGIRLEFKVTPKTLDFREIFYSTPKFDNSLPMLKELFTEIKAKYGLPFNFAFSSKIGAYYIKGKFQNENEFRFIIKTTADDYNAWGVQSVTVNEEKAIEYIEIDFLNDYADFELLTVQPGYNCSDDDIREIESIIVKSGLSAMVTAKALENYI